MAHNIALVGHCLINPATIVKGRGRDDELANRTLSLLLKNKVGLLQLPCPEYLTLGARRWAQSKDQYDVPIFRNRCSELIAPIIEQVAEHLAAGDKIVAVIGIEGSPTCAISSVTRANWGGLPPCAGGPEADSPRKCEESGVLIEIFADALKKLGCSVAFIGFPGKNAKLEEKDDFLHTLEKLCK